MAAREKWKNYRKEGTWVLTCMYRSSGIASCTQARPGPWIHFPRPSQIRGPAGQACNFSSYGLHAAQGQRKQAQSACNTSKFTRKIVRLYMHSNQAYRQAEPPSISPVCVNQERASRKVPPKALPGCLLNSHLPTSLGITSDQSTGESLPVK